MAERCNLMLKGIGINAFINDVMIYPFNALSVETPPSCFEIFKNYAVDGRFRFLNVPKGTILQLVRYSDIQKVRISTLGANEALGITMNLPPNGIMELPIEESYVISILSDTSSTASFLDIEEKQELNMDYGEQVQDYMDTDNSEGKEETLEDVTDISV